MIIILAAILVFVGGAATQAAFEHNKTRKALIELSQPETAEKQPTK
jgi:hypothetical protein